MSVDQGLYDRLMAMADECFERGYKPDPKHAGGYNGRKSEKAVKARDDLEALQYAIAFLKDEKRLDGYHNITPVNTPFMRHLAAQYA